MSYWDILITLTVLEFILAAILFYLVFKLSSKPFGRRLTMLSIVFLLQSLIGVFIYNHWKNMGYGAEISIPLIALQSTIIAGTIILIDTTRI